MLTLNLLPDVKKNLIRAKRERNLVMFISMVSMIASGVIIFILLATWGSLKIVAETTKSDINKNRHIIEKARQDKQLNKYLTIQNQLKQLTGLKDKQSVYSRLNNYLSGLNPDRPNNASIRTVTISSAESGDGITMRIEGYTSTFASLDVYKNTLINADLIYEDQPPQLATVNSKKDGKESQGANPLDKFIEKQAEGEGDKAGSDKDKESLAKKEKLFTSVDVLSSAMSAGESGTRVNFTIEVVFNANAFSNKVYNPRIEIPHLTTSDGVRSAPKVTFNSDKPAGSSQSVLDALNPQKLEQNDSGKDKGDDKDGDKGKDSKPDSDTGANANKEGN